MQCVVNREIWLDPTEEEGHLAEGSLVFACIPALGIVTNTWQTGRILPQDTLQVRLSLLAYGQPFSYFVVQCLESCQERCTDIHQIVSRALLDNAEKSIT